MLSPATPHDTLDIYALLYDTGFQDLPDYSAAKGILESADTLILKDNGKVLIWAAYHGKEDTFLDLVIAPDMPRGKITRHVCKHLLAHGLKLSQNNRIVVEAYNPKGVKAALQMGFAMDEAVDREGWVRLVLTREQFERKFGMRGKSL